MELTHQLEQLHQERNEEIKLWEQKQIDLEQALGKIKKVMNFNLTNHKEATDRLRVQLKEQSLLCDQKENENKAL